MCRSNCCGGCMSIFLMILLVSTAAVPWYFQAVHVDESAPVAADCVAVQLISWNKNYAAVSDGENCAPLKQAFPSEPQNWRDVCDTVDEIGGDHVCKKIRTTFDVALAFVLLSAFCGFLSMIGFILRCCESRHGQKSSLLFIITLVGFACLLVSVVAFAVTLPKAYTKGGSQVLLGKDCSEQNGEAAYGPCKSFWGTKHQSPATIVWAPLGWAIGVFTCVWYSIVLCLSRAQPSVPLYVESQQQIYQNQQQSVGMGYQQAAPGQSPYYQASNQNQALV